MVGERRAVPGDQSGVVRHSCSTRRCSTTRRSRSSRYDGGKRIAATLGDKKLCILRNHGLLTRGRIGRRGRRLVRDGRAGCRGARQGTERHGHLRRGRGDRRARRSPRVDRVAALPVATAQRRRRPRCRGSGGRGLESSPVRFGAPSILRCSKTSVASRMTSMLTSRITPSTSEPTSISRQIAITATNRSRAKAPNARNTPMLTPPK